LQNIHADGWVKVIPLTINDGPGTARNVDWEVAKESYIAFLDADDSWHPEKLRIQNELIWNNPDVALCGHQ
jgi:glycosyltransferase involved in cell wall biosynthesis